MRIGVMLLVCSLLVLPALTVADDGDTTTPLELMESACYDWALSGGRDVMKGILCAIYTLWTGDFNYDRPWG